MPLVRLTYPRGALSPSHKRRLAASLTDVVLDAEVDGVTDAGRSVTLIHFNEVAADDWAVAGELRSPASSASDHFIVDLIVLQGLLEGERRRAVHRRVTSAFQQALPDDATLPLRVWVLVHEVREGSWRVAGTTVGALDVAQYISPVLDDARREEIAAAVRR
jgi:phenylpyruvate tautomerase PptA (4-oxalocrotonate tautomerase family)